MQMSSRAVVVLALLGRVCAGEAAAACATASIDGCSSAKTDETALLQLDSGDISASKQGLNKPRRWRRRRGRGKNGAYSYTYGKYGYKAKSTTTSTTADAVTLPSLCNYVIEISRSDQGANTPWLNRTATGPPGATFETGRDFEDFCSTTANGAGFCDDTHNITAIRVIKNSTGDIVGTGVCCNFVTNHIVRVISDCGPTMPGPPVCTYTVGIARSDFPRVVNFNQKVAGPPGDSFTFDGTCSTTLPGGPDCVNKHNVAAGVRILKNSQNESVSSGHCCNSIESSVLTVTNDCDE
ncbi:unnamed protein product [Symbiodinium sp. CCMP2592]|nr:unnamed protein product [Symbiodinium sp. CCMP2592]